MNQNLRSLTRCALFAALMCILSPLAIPVGPVPVTLGTFVLVLIGMMLPWRQAGCAVGIYLLMGCVGLPVFSGGGAGPGMLFGPTGGYLWCYLPMVLLVSAGKGNTLLRALACSAAAFLLCYTCGSWQFTHVVGVGWREALGSCVFPFLPFDAVKLACACIIGTRLRRRLEQAGLM